MTNSERAPNPGTEVAVRINEASHNTTSRVFLKNTPPSINTESEIQKS